jgi:hypothetical protein
VNAEIDDVALPTAVAIFRKIRMDYNALKDSHSVLLDELKRTSTNEIHQMEQMLFLQELHLQDLQNVTWRRQFEHW